MTCPPPIDHLRPTNDAERARIDAFFTHADGCKPCARSVAVLARLDHLISTLVRGQREIVGPCPEPEALVTWLAGERALARRLELHLVACAECREDVIAASVAQSWTARVAAVSTRRMRLSSARLATRSQPDPPAEARTPARRAGLIAGAIGLAALWATTVAQGSTPRARDVGPGVSMPAAESAPNALKRVAQLEDPAEGSDRR